MTGTGGTALLFFFCRAAAGQNVVAFAACRGRSVLQHGIWCRSCRGCSHSMAVGHRTCRRKPFVLHQGAAPTIHRFENREKAFTERRQRVINAGRNDRINCAGNQTVFFQFAELLGQQLCFFSCYTCKGSLQGGGFFCRYDNISDKRRER